MNAVPITINGRGSEATCPDRTHLADFVRDHLHLTGTHLGCEHGVCGACTVLVDGKPTRSCITFTPACAGRSVTTVEGYGDDEVMAQLRAAFTTHHGLQCGFCTPGMLATSRDIVLRFPDADEALIRQELSGNLCRCTGYMGIVSAIKAVLEVRRTRVGDALPFAPKPTPPADAVASVGPFTTFAVDPQSLPNYAATSTDDGTRAADKEGWSRVEADFVVPYPAADVWNFMLGLPEVAACLPGAVLTSETEDRVEGYVAIKFGPMSARFTGTARLERDAQARRGVLKGAGKDSLSNSRAAGNVAYVVHEDGPEKARVAVDLQFSLQGPLAQFSRSGLVKDFVRRMIADFGQNVTRRMDPRLTAAQRQALTPHKSNPMTMLLAVLWDRIKVLFGKSRTK